MHGYFLNHTEHARRILNRSEAAICTCISTFITCRCSRAPGRNHRGEHRLTAISRSPGCQAATNRRWEINYPYLFDLLDSLGYQRWIGCEYRPRGNTWEGLAWAARYGIRPPEVLSAK